MWVSKTVLLRLLENTHNMCLGTDFVQIVEKNIWIYEILEKKKFIDSNTIFIQFWGITVFEMSDLGVSIALYKMKALFSLACTRSISPHLTLM